MGLPRHLVDEVRRLDEGALRQLLILARGLLVDAEEPVVWIDDIPGMPAVRYRQKRVSCGKATCTGCPHGPYWYAHWTEDGRRRSRYIGAELPGEVRRKVEALERAREAASASSSAAVGSARTADGTSDGAGRPDGRRLRVIRD